MPIGPLYKYISVIDDRWGTKGTTQSVVENIVGADIDAFLVATANDARQMRKILDECKHTKVTIHKVPFNENGSKKRRFSDMKLGVRCIRLCVCFYLLIHPCIIAIFSDICIECANVNMLPIEKATMQGEIDKFSHQDNERSSIQPFGAQKYPSGTHQ